MTHNFRPTQPIHDRVIYYNGGAIKEITENTISTDRKKKSSGNTILINTLLIIFTFMIISFLY